MRDPKLQTTLEYAASLGTLNQIDRSKQYEDQRYSASTLLNNDNLLFEKVRSLEKTKFRHAIMLLVSSFVLGNAHAIYAWLAKVL